MKKVLLGTTALVSAGLVAQQAQAADPIQLSIGGYQNWALFWADNDDAPATGTIPAEPGFNKGSSDIKYIGEVHFKGKTVLDNGLEVGVRFELEGETGGDNMDETYAYVEGSFGQVRVGNDDPVSYAMATAAPYINYVFNANSPSVYGNGLSQFFGQTTGLLRSRFSAGGTATFATFPNQSGDDAQLAYFSPVFNGFQFGVSYKMDTGEARDADLYLLPVKTGGGHAGVLSVGGRYDGEIGELGVTVAGGYMEMAHRALNNAAIAPATSEVWNAGLVLYYGAWGFGGSYMGVDDQLNISGTDTEAFDLGIAYYSDGPWSAGFYYMWSETDYAAGNLVATSVTDEFQAFSLIGQYEMGPGIALTGTVGFDQFTNGVISQDYDSTLIGTAIMIDFSALPDPRAQVPSDQASAQPRRARH